MSLTKKDFKKLAEILRVGVGVDSLVYVSPFNFAVNDLVNDLCIWFKSENPKFDEDKFRKEVLK